MHPFYPALLMLLPLALAAPDKPRRSADERLARVADLGAVHLDQCRRCGVCSGAALKVPPYAPPVRAGSRQLRVVAAGCCRR
eukprot:COSAG01_NODE_434_length_17079_cov_11.829270_11_plen_82_part_00